MDKKLVIAEKPSAARDYAKALNCNNKKDGYIEGEEYIITWCLGHLFTLKEPEDYNKDYKEWFFADLPIVPKEFQIKPTKRGKKQFKIIKKLINREDVSLIINGGDAGREGELIQRYVINYSGTNKPVKRLWVSSLTEEAIREGFNNLKDQSEYDNLYLSAKTRAKLDWLLGINYTRAYTTKNEGNNTIIIGRVQTAILNLIAKRDQKREEFNPKIYNQIIAEFKNYKGKYINQDGNTKVFSFPESNKIKLACEGNKGKVIKIEKKEKEKNAPKLFNLTGLQKRMNKKYGFAAQKTLDIAQKLYEQYKILSYPRSDSKYLSETHKKELPAILKNINFKNFQDHISKLDLKNLNFSKRFIDDDKITDHHAIIPTDNNKTSNIYNNKLNSDEQKLFDEVSKRLIAQFSNPYKYATTKIITKIDKYKFRSKGKMIINSGWKNLYSTNVSNKKLPELKKGETKEVKQVKLKEDKTNPPKAYNENRLLTKLEKHNIGTEATRAGIIEKLLGRKYIKRKGKKLISTDSGKKIIETIITDSLKNPEMTGKLEDKLEKIRAGKRDHKEVLKEEIEKLKTEIEKLETAEIKVNKEEKKTICSCPKCDSGKIIKRNWGYGCSNWNNEADKCDFSIGKIKGKMLTKNQVKRLIQKGETKKLKGFKSKNDKKFSAKLKLKDNCKIEFIFESNDLGSCPKCKGKIKDKGKFYGCSEYPDCDFKLWKKIASKQLTKNQVKRLIEKGETKKLKGFKGKHGKFSAKVKLTDDYKTEFVFDKKKKAKDINLYCPICGEEIQERSWGYGCSGYPQCDFSISKEIANKKITRHIVKTICKHQETGKLKGFKSKKGGFEAKLVLKDGDVELVY